MYKLSVHVEEWSFPYPLRITGHTFTELRVLIVELNSGETVGRGEAVGIYYLNETPESMLKQITDVQAVIEKGISRDELLTILPHGGARNALDSALWDLECKLQQTSIWELNHITPEPLNTVFTLSIQDDMDILKHMADRVRIFSNLKIKLDDRDPAVTLKIIRQTCPDASIMIDANQAWTMQQLIDYTPICLDMGIKTIEQPLARGNDMGLSDYNSPIPICADESCISIRDLDDVSSRYQMINIKLDKVGGLTAALQLADEAERKGLKLMVGNMSGTSLSMAPAFILGLRCEVIDLDGPLLLSYDRPFGLDYQGSLVSPPEARLWG